MELHFYSLTKAAARADDALGRLSPAARDAFAGAAQRQASRHGLRRGPQDIPLVLSPVSLPREELSQLGRAARHVVSALVKVARDVIERQPEKKQLLFGHLAPLELAALETRYLEAEELLVAKNPGNAQWLVEALLRAAKAAGRGAPGEPFPRGLSVQLLHREGDPQLSELEVLAELLRQRGAQARTVTPAEVVLDGDRARALYRHLFARYVEVGSALGQALLDPARHAIWNRVDGWLETKGLFAELSAHAEESGHLLDADERAAIARYVPFTRLLDDLADGRLGDGDAFVLKKSHDYGGKSVFIGRERGPAAFRAALAAARRDPPGTWVVQELIDAPALLRWLTAAGEGGSLSAQRAGLHLDVSTYASLLPGVPDGGSVCRAAPGRVVNIVGGGGVAPLFADDILSEALDATRWS